MEETGVVQEERRWASGSLPMVEEGAGLLVEGRGGGFKQVGIAGRHLRGRKGRSLQQSRGKAQPFTELFSLMGSSDDWAECPEEKKS